MSQGTAYSSRAFAALTCQATLNPDNLLGYQAALFANQPAENTEGLTETELAALVDNPVDIAGGLTAGDCLALSQANTEQALYGSITNLAITRIQGTPTVLVNGSLYSGGLTDPKELLDFLHSAAAG